MTSGYPRFMRDMDPDSLLCYALKMEAFAEKIGPQDSDYARVKELADKAINYAAQLEKAA